MASLATAALVAGLAGTAVTAYGTLASGKAQQEQYEAEAIARQQELTAQGKAQSQAAEFEAKQLDIRAKQEFAAAQQEALELRRNKKLALSTLQARAAGGGFSATDPTALALADEIERYGTFQEQLALYGGDVRREDLKRSAQATRFSGQSAAAAAYRTGQSVLQAGFASGKAARTASLYDAGGTILGGISSFANKYAKRPVASAWQPTTTVYRYGRGE